MTAADTNRLDPFTGGELLTDEEARRRRRLLRTFIPNVRPAGWRFEVNFTPSQFRAVKGGLLGVPPAMIVIVGIEVHEGLDWVHLSVSRPGMEVPWRDMLEARDLFLGAETQALQVLPPRSEHFNIHPDVHVMHMYAFPDRRRVLPDFRIGGAI